MIRPDPDQTRLLIATVGIPYSGKSTWARSQPWPIVSPDAIRFALHGQRFIPQAEPMVWAVAKTMVSSLFNAGHETVVLDACNTTRKRREEWLSSDWLTVFRTFYCLEFDCLARASNNNDLYILDVIRRMHANFEELQHGELRFTKA